MQGQAAHFVKFAPEQIEYGIKRYTNETKRLYGVIEKALSDGRQWLAAGEYTIADIANFSWMYVHQMAGDLCLDYESLLQDVVLSLAVLLCLQSTHQTSCLRSPDTHLVMVQNKPRL